MLWPTINTNKQEDAAPQIRPHCGTSAEQVRHKCGTSAAKVRSKCGASAEQVRLHRVPVGQGPPGPDWLGISFGFWFGRALATGTAWAGLCLIHHHHKGAKVRHKAVARLPMTRLRIRRLKIIQRQRLVRPDHRGSAVVFGAPCACGRRSRHLTGEQRHIPGRGVVFR